MVRQSPPPPPLTFVKARAPTERLPLLLAVVLRAWLGCHRRHDSVFEININAFCTVLEYCEGTDLDQLLKEHKTLNEKLCRSVVSQVCSGLRHLNEQTPSIIHYDLKPGNILVQHGAVKITDFVRARDHPPQASHRADLLRPNRRRRRHRPSAYVPDWLTDAVLTDAVCCYVVMWSHV
jgi:serine/threonine protein kinase